MARLPQFSLSTFLLGVIAIGIGIFVVLHSSAWVPEANTLTLGELTDRYPVSSFKECSPDGTRTIVINNVPPHIYSAGASGRDLPIFDFTIRDADSETSFILGAERDGSPMHCALGFLDDDRCMMARMKGDDAHHDYAFRIWRRRYPEWWWGHFYRPEVWALMAAALGLVIDIIRHRRRSQASIAS